MLKVKLDIKMFTHDCSKCNYLFSILGAKVDGLYVSHFDVYHHSGDHETYVLRYGSDGPAYISGKPGILLNYGQDVKDILWLAIAETKQQ
ncbi:MAG: hypothetical protein PQJ59_16890 [Spirochaetales bacterium]|nr:hypothetical protein [Spirochaetales bacterium]